MIKEKTILLFKVSKKIIKNPKELLTYSKILYKIIIIDIFYKKEKMFINNGERFDPLLTTGYIDRSHLPRYYFAKTFLSKEDTVLDIASGTGYGTEILSKDCKNITGVDISSDAVKYAKESRKGENLNFIRNDLYKNNVYTNVVISFETIEHIPNKKIEETIEKLISYADKLVIGSYPYKEKKGNNPHHFQFNLDENNLNGFKEKYDIDIYYQDLEGQIYKERLNRNIRNLIFTLKK